MCNFLSCKILQGPHPAALDQEGLPFSIPDAYWSIKKSYTFLHAPSYAPSNQMYHPFTCHEPFNKPVLFPDYFSGTRLRLQCTFHLHIYAMHTLQCDTYMLDLSFSTYYDVAKLQIVCGEQIQPHCLGNIQECCSSLTSAVVLPR